MEPAPIGGAAADAVKPPEAEAKKRRRAVEYGVEDLVAARAGEALLHKHLTMSEADFSKATRDTPRKVESVFSLLVIEKPEGIPKNATLSLKKLREIFLNYSGELVWDGKRFMENLLVGKLACGVCVGAGATAGVFECNLGATARHFTSQTHADRVHALQAQKAPREQLDLHQLGFVPPSVDLLEQQRLGRVLAVGHLVAGGDGAAPIPPYAIPYV